MTELVRTGAIDPPVDRVFDFTELPQALELMANADQLGKIALRVGG